MFISYSFHFIDRRRRDIFIPFPPPYTLLLYSLAANISFSFSFIRYQDFTLFVCRLRTNNKSKFYGLYVYIANEEGGSRLSPVGVKVSKSLMAFN